MTNNIRRFRKAERYTLDDLSKTLNLSKSTISKIENGIQKLYIDQAIILADFFKCSLDELVGREFVTPEKTIIKTIDFTYNDMITKLSSLTLQEINKLNGAIDLTLENKQGHSNQHFKQTELFTHK